MQSSLEFGYHIQGSNIREESTTANQQFLDSIDEGMKKIIKEQVKKEVSKITPKIKKLVTDQLESEVLVRSSKEANTSHAVAANLSELELKKILIDKMEANNSINRSDIQRQLYKALVDAYEADKILLDTYGDTVTIKRPRDGADDDQEPSAGTDRGQQEKTTVQDLRLKENSASQSANGRGSYGQSTDVFEPPCTPGVRNRKPTKPQRIIGLDHPEGIDDVLYKFKKATSMTRIQDIKDISVVIQRRVEDLQLGVESYQKKLNLTKPDTYRSNLRRQDAYTPYSDPRGFIYENKDKKNRLMRIDELHKFSAWDLDDVRTALNDRLKGIRMEYLPQTFWSQRDKANARAMIQAIEKRLKTRRIMRSLERFVGGRPYGGDLRLLQRTI
ncbi:hypothetical protein Tco_1345460 [Tanacetum coccineum]